MSLPHHGRDMDRSAAPLGSVRRAREKAQTGPMDNDRLKPPPIYTQDSMGDVPPAALRAPPRRMMEPPQAPPPPPPGQIRVPKVRAPPANDSRNAVSRPTQVPQWPLPGPLPHHDPERYRPPPGRSQQAPPRPPRPSQVPSMLDQSRLQDPAPVFFNPDSDYYSDSPTSPSSQTSSNFDDPQDQDHPANSSTHPAGQPRRGTALGPPPSARRGASSFYSNPSYVSPIPEESLASASRSHGSYASSAAMPDNWPTVSREQSPTFYDDADGDKSRGYDDITDESKLVRSASIGKRGKPALVHTKSSGSAGGIRSPVERRRSQNGQTGRQESQNSWIAMTAPNMQSIDESRSAALTPDAILGAYAAASATDLADNRIKSPEPMIQPQSPMHTQIHPNPQFNPPSTLRRPPRLDIDAVRSMEERGSMTSLPDLIRRATQLATMMDRGRRPASRFDDINEYLDEKSYMHSGEKESSGLSDMLAAFPPPAHPHARRSRGSWFRTTSWPLAPHRDLLPPPRAGLRNVGPQNDGKKDKRGRCCGLPMWAFILLILLLVGIIAAAVFVPLEFFVFKNLVGRSSSTSELSQCQKSLSCENGGTNVITGGTCSCICTNGYTGSDCSTSGSDGCTTTDIVSTDDETISNVTLGKALPRLIADSNANFSIPLSGTDVLAKINNSDLSCIAQNSLVTFDGSATRKGGATDKAKATQKKMADKRDVNAAAATTAISVSPDDAATTLVVDNGSLTATGTSSSAAAEATTTDTAKSTATFAVTEEVLDFARVAVLYVLQEESEEEAEDAQTSLQDFFSEADTSDGVTQSKATSLKIGGDNTIDLVNYSLNIGNGTVGGKATKRDVTDGAKLLPLERDLNQRNSRRGGAVLPPR